MIENYLPLTQILEVIETDKVTKEFNHMLKLKQMWS